MALLTDEQKQFLRDSLEEVLKRDFYGFSGYRGRLKGIDYIVEIKSFKK